MDKVRNSYLSFILLALCIVVMLLKNIWQRSVWKEEFVFSYNNVYSAIVDTVILSLIVVPIIFVYKYLLNKIRSKYKKYSDQSGKS